VYLFVYGIFYYSTKLDIMGFTSRVICLRGRDRHHRGIGFGASFFFVRKIYASIKVD
jgi:hypothetical protein